MEECQKEIKNAERQDSSEHNMNTKGNKQQYFEIQNDMIGRHRRKTMWRPMRQREKQKKFMDTAIGIWAKIKMLRTHMKAE